MESRSHAEVSECAVAVCARVLGISRSEYLADGCGEMCVPAPIIISRVMVVGEAAERVLSYGFIE